LTGREAIVFVSRSPMFPKKKSELALKQAYFS